MALADAGGPVASTGGTAITLPRCGLVISSVQLLSADQTTGCALGFGGMPVWTMDYGRIRLELSERALKRAQHLDKPRGTQANDLENDDWETWHVNSPTIADYWSRHQAPTSTRGLGDAM